ncbi:hypothetical protein [Streptomyces sp. NPDC096030]|uniref:hypothetical protein n=1 Tax=Streptomyces sp. NPDC096030 TaxID=3155423 RepID=UPI003322B858
MAPAVTTLRAGRPDRHLSPDTAGAYAQQLRHPALTLAGWTESAELTLTPEADAVLAYQRVAKSRLRTFRGFRAPGPS